MSILCCSCKCRNVQIQGLIVPFQMNESKLQKEKKSSNFSKSSFLIQIQSIQVQNKKLSKKSLKNRNMCDFIRCLNCSTTFKFRYKNNKIYIERIQMQNACNNNGNEQVKVDQCDDVYQNVSVNDIDNKYINNDGDFELMFSNKYYPFVGSCKDCPLPFMDESLVNDSYTDFQQMSY